MTYFTEWLFHEMQLRGWNQADLADRAGVSRGAVSHVFSGVRKPGIEMLQGMARALEMPTEQVFKAAGLLENTEEQVAIKEQPVSLGEWMRLFLEADEPTRDVMLDNARYFAQRNAHKKKE